MIGVPTIAVVTLLAALMNYYSDVTDGSGSSYLWSAARRRLLPQVWSTAG